MRLAAARAISVVVVLAAAPARAAGPELVEQSPQGVAVAGAQAADTQAPAAIAYDPAALAFQPGLTLQGGGAAVAQSTTATLGPAGSASSSASLAAMGVPAVFVGQRVAARYAVGLGVYAPFAWSSSWPGSFVARAQGVSSSWRAVDVSPGVAFRPRPWFALGLAIDIVPTTISLRRVVPDWFLSAARSVDASATGIGGHAGLLFRVVPRWLDAAVTYRSALRLELAGRADTLTAGALPPVANARATTATPHAFTFALASHPLPMLTLTADVRWVLWHALSSLDLTLTDAMGAGPTVHDVTRLGYHDTAGVRAGAQLGLAPDGDGVARLVLRVGGGFEEAPASAAQSPLFADGDRGLVSAGVGARFGVFSLDIGYAAAIGVARGGYAPVTHVAAAAVTLRLPDLGYHIDEPDYKRP